MPKQPDWRKVEAALIDLLRTEGFELEQTGGETSVRVWIEPELDPCYINLADFARAIADRIE